jgi:hypothetical protein
MHRLRCAGRVVGWHGVGVEGRVIFGTATCLWLVGHPVILPVAGDPSWRNGCHLALQSACEGGTSARGACRGRAPLSPAHRVHVGVLNGVACPTATTCVAVGSDPGNTGGIVVSLHRSASQGWTPGLVQRFAGVAYGVACPSVHECLVVGDLGAELMTGGRLGSLQRTPPRGQPTSRRMSQTRRLRGGRWDHQRR